MYGRYFVLFAILFTGWFLRKINFIDDKMDHSSLWSILRIHA